MSLPKLTPSKKRRRYDAASKKSKARRKLRTLRYQGVKRKRGERPSWERRFGRPER